MKQREHNTQKTSIYWAGRIVHGQRKEVILVMAKNTLIMQRKNAT